MRNRIKCLLVIFAAIVISSFSIAQKVTKVIPQFGPRSSDPANMIVFDSITYFSSNDGDSGIELWKTNGTFEGTKLVKDIYNGNSSSVPENLVLVNNILFFSADDGMNGRELWMSDGTSIGTVEVRDIDPFGSSDPKNLINIDGLLFFSCNGNELWKSDGTVAGTVLITAFINLVDAKFNNFYKFSDVVVFSADNGIHGIELWKSDGTESGTMQIKDIYNGNPSSEPSDFAVINNTLIFSADDGVNGKELWKSDGTSIGTVVIKNINPNGGSIPQNLTNVNGSILFSADDGVNGTELWKSDGTEMGTALVKNIQNGIESSDPANFTIRNDTLFFSADDGLNGRELWRSDGNETNTVLIKDINPSGSSDLSFLTNVNGTLFFSAEVDNSREIWRSNGTASGTVILKDIDPNGSSNPSNIVNMNGVVLFTANDRISGNELWKSDGTSSGTVLIKDIYSNASSTSYDVVGFDSTILYSDEDGTLWRSDGTSSGTHVIKKDINTYPSSSVFNLTRVYEEVFFGANIDELWKSDGTYEGTSMVKHLDDGFSYLENLINANGTLFFRRDDYALWKSDGTETGTIELNNWVNPFSMTHVNGAVYFMHGNLWKSDGTVNGTVKIFDPPYGVLEDATNLVDVNGTLFFAGTDTTSYYYGSANTELWKSDGTVSGTVIVKDINTNGNSFPENLTNVNGVLFFDADDGVNGRELWKSDGTTAGTMMVKDITLNGDTDFDNLTNVNGVLYFSADDGVNGAELWKSDGTVGGTAMIKNINTIGDSNPDNFRDLNGIIFFSADDGINGAELWKSDGTYAGTVLAKNIDFNGDSYPSNFTTVNGALFFSAYHVGNERALWKAEPFKKIYVDTLAISADKNGCNWQNAFIDLSQALRMSMPGDSIFMAKGTYFPDTTGLSVHRFATFKVPDNIVLIGGFDPASGDTTRSKRNPSVNKTILSGDIGILGDSSDNCYHVVTANNVDNSILDGFQIENGLADHVSEFNEQHGGGIAIKNADLSIRNCIFQNNSSSSDGHALFASGGDVNLNIDNSLFYNQYATNNSEYTIFAFGGSYCTITNSTFVNNLKCVYAHTFSNVSINNSILWENGMGDVLFEGITFTGTITVNNSLIEGGYAGIGNINAYPKFTDTTTHDYSIQPTSPATNAGNSVFFSAGSVDLAGNKRIQQGIIDMGAFEADLCEIIDPIIYVDHAATGNNDGSSWIDAYESLDSAMIKASWCDTIFVAEGTYMPSMHPVTRVDAGRDNAFLLHEAVHLFGGFPTGGSALSGRDIELYPTILSGEVGLIDIADNLHHIIIVASAAEESESTIDGFVFSDANANGTSNIVVNGQTIDRSQGGSIIASGANIMINNCQFVNNTATTEAAIYGEGGGFISLGDCSFDNNNSSANGAVGFSLVDVVIDNCQFANNTASGNSGGAAGVYSNTNVEFLQCLFDSNILSGTGYGGAVSIAGSSTFDRCIFKNNTASVYGGAIHIGGDQTDIFNCLFHNNNSTRGGAIYVRGQDAIANILNSTFAKNDGAGSGDGLYARNATVNILNSILYHNGSELDKNSGATISVFYSNIEGSYAGIGNIDADPQFADTLFDDYRLQITSPCLNTGINDSIPEGLLLDLDGNPRIINDTVDMGAYEYLIDCIHPEYAILDSVFTKLDGQNWANNSGWKDNCEPCTWYGIVCDVEGNIVELNLDSNNLSGQLPVELAQLNHLTRLKLHGNTGISGCYPNNLENLCGQLGAFSTNANISDNTNLDATWEDFCVCNASICPCNETNVWQGGVDNWNVATNWSLGHAPRACETVQIANAIDIVTVPVGEYPVIYLLEVSNGAELLVPAGQKIHVLADPGFNGWDVCD